MAPRLVAALAALIAAGPAAAYVRTRDPGTGAELHWAIPTVAWRLNRAWPNASPTCAATDTGDPTLAAARASFAAWEQSCAEIRLVYGGTTDEIRTGLGGTSENIVVFRRGWCSQHPQAKNDPCMNDPDVDCGGIYDCFEDACAPDAATCADWGIVALTSVLYDPRTGRIMDADVEVNGWDGFGSGSAIGSPPAHGWYFTCAEAASASCGTYGQDACAYIDLQNTLTHEVGHFVGLAHTPPHAAGTAQEAWPTMEATTSPGETWKRSLSADDVEGVCAIYPPPSGGSGCGSTGAAGPLSMVLAALALLRRARAVR